MNGLLQVLAAQARMEEMRRAALARPSAVRDARQLDANPVTLRLAFPDDALALLRLAALDSAEVPPSPILLAEVAGNPRAALSLSDGMVIADPFHQTAHLVNLLRARARQIAPRARRGARRRRWRRADGAWLEQATSCS